jgi:hypothetical protein
MNKITHISPASPASRTPRLPRVLITDGWWLGEFSMRNTRRPARAGQAVAGSGASAKILPFRTVPENRRNKT